MEVISSVSGAAEHSFTHGEDMLVKLLTMASMPKVRSTVAAWAVQRVLGSLPLILVAACPHETVVPMQQVTPQRSIWHHGFNINPTDLEAKLLALLQKGLADNGL